MSVYLSADTAGAVLYTVPWLRHTAGRYGVPVTDDPDEADAFWVSVQSTSDLPLLRRTHRLAAGRPVIAGGLNCATGNGAPLQWATACVVGEGEEFIRAWGEGGIDKALSLPCVTLRDDPDRPVTPSTEVDYTAAPVVRVSEAGWYALAARGCRNHCAFCFTSWATQPSQAPAALSRHQWRAAEAITGKRTNVTFITNDSRGLPKQNRGGAQSVMVRDYLAKPAAYAGLNMARVGIEGMTEARRAWWGKPLSDADIRAAIEQALELNQMLEMFFIAGFSNQLAEWREFVTSCLPLAPHHGRPVVAKFTTFNAVPLTPMWRYDVTGLEPLDEPLMWKEGVARMRSFNTHGGRSLERALLDSAWVRVRWDDADRMPYAVPRDGPDKMIADMQAKGLGYTLAPRPCDRLPGEQVLMWNARQRRARAIKMGIESADDGRDDHGRLEVAQ